MEERWRKLNADPDYRMIGETDLALELRSARHAMGVDPPGLTAQSGEAAARRRARPARPSCHRVRRDCVPTQSRCQSTR